MYVYTLDAEPGAGLKDPCPYASTAYIDAYTAIDHQKPMPVRDQTCLRLREPGQFLLPCI